MAVGAEEQQELLRDLNEADGPFFKIKDDPRVTRVGRWLRRLSLDELPQLYNVLRGDMSLIGPRPPVPEEVAHYQPWHMRRLEIAPGITGLWQVSGRSELPFDEMALLDIYYAEQWSPALDVKILLRTIPTVVFGDGAY
jgi:lipopolysaccharide/colanic/teichoic acid biosynthesis glycosyltransferase